MNPRKFMVFPVSRNGFRERLLFFCLVLSGAVHLALYLLVFHQPVFTERAVSQNVPDEPMRVRIVLNEVTVLPEQEPEEAPEEPKEEKEEILVVEHAPTEPVPVEPELAEHGEEEPAPDDIVEEPQADEPEVSATTEDLDQIGHDYWSRVCRRIARSIRYPHRALSGRWSGRVTVHLKVEKDGTLTGGVMPGNRIRPEFEQAVLQAIRRSSPVDPPPSELGAPLEADLPIRFTP